MSESIAISFKHTEIDCKRLYLPEFMVSLVCPSCGHTNYLNLGDYYFSYPYGDSIYHMKNCCLECSEEITFGKVTLDFKCNFELSPEVKVEALSDA